MIEARVEVGSMKVHNLFHAWSMAKVSSEGSSDKSVQLLVVVLQTRLKLQRFFFDECPQ